MDVERGRERWVQCQIRSNYWHFRYLKPELNHFSTTPHFSVLPLVSDVLQPCYQRSRCDWQWWVAAARPSVVECSTASCRTWRPGTSWAWLRGLFHWSPCGNKCHIQRNKHPVIRMFVQQMCWLTDRRPRSRHARRASSVNKWHFLIKSIIVQHWRSEEVFHQGPSVIGLMRNPACVARPWQWRLLLYNRGWLNMLKLFLFVSLSVRRYGRFLHVNMHSTFIFSIYNCMHVTLKY